MMHWVQIIHQAPQCPQVACEMGVIFDVVILAFGDEETEVINL